MIFVRFYSNSMYLLYDVFSSLNQGIETPFIGRNRNLWKAELSQIPGF